MNDKKSDRLGTMVFTIANELVNHFGKKLDRPVIDDITRNLTLEMCSGPTAWAFSGKDEPGQPIYDEAKELERCRANWEKTGVGVVFADYWAGWEARFKYKASLVEHDDGTELRAELVLAKRYLQQALAAHNPRSRLSCDIRRLIGMNPMRAKAGENE